jgi:hypothetical protein
MGPLSAVQLLDEGGSPVSEESVYAGERDSELFETEPVLFRS